MSFTANYKSSHFSAIIEVYGCCGIEIQSIQSSLYDWGGENIEITNLPEEANLLIVGGWISSKLEERIKQIYVRMKKNCHVIALGGCTISGSGYLVSGPRPDLIKITDILPVDVLVSGCPPSPELIWKSIAKIKNKINPEKKQRELLYDAVKGLKVT